MTRKVKFGYAAFCCDTELASVRNKAPWTVKTIDLAASSGDLFKIDATRDFPPQVLQTPAQFVTGRSDAMTRLQSI